MKNIHTLETISDLINELGDSKAKHPLVAVVDFANVEGYGEQGVKMSAGFYSIILKNHCYGSIKYGREYYDFQEGIVLCIAPGQVVTFEEAPIPNKVVGWGLFFHPDLIRGTSLGNKIKNYNYFSYEINEALHLSDKEKQTLNDCILKIEDELSQNIDNHSQTLIVSNIELLLNYCSRYYDRQFITRKNNNQDILIKFENVLTDYFNSDNLENESILTVKYCAEKLSLSPNYLSDLLKKETGKNAQDHIHYYLIEEAKNNLLNTTSSISEIAYQLGFEYPQYFSKLFKSKTGTTPAEYRNLS